MRETRIRTALLLIGFALAFAAGYLLFNEWPTGLLRVSTLDVGQGDSIYVRSPDGIDLLIDGGPDDGVGRTLGSMMPAYDRSLDFIAITHSDLDHIGGLVGIMDRYDVGTVIVSNSTSTEPARLALDAAVARSGAAVVAVSAGDRIDLDPANGVYLDVLHPREGETEQDSNERSLVMRLVYASTSVMLTGDAGEPTEAALVTQYGSSLDSDVLKVGHHGSDSSSIDSFVGFVSPAFSLISAGQDNRYGHPTQAVVDRLIASGSEVLETKNEGSITLVSDGASFRRLK